MEKIELYNVNFLLTNENSKLNKEGKNQLLDSFINIYSTSLDIISRVNGLNISPRHHFLEEFADFIDNLNEIQEYIAKGCEETPLVIGGIQAINTYDKSQSPILINGAIDYIDENVALFSINDQLTPDDSDKVYEKLSKSEFEIVDYGIIKGAEKIKILIPQSKK